MSETKTTDDLVNRAAAILGVLVVGEALGSVESETIKACIQDVLDEISSIVYIGDQNEIPARLFSTIARILSLHAAAEFSGAPLDMDQILRLENRLRYLVAQESTGAPVRAVYF